MSEAVTIGNATLYLGDCVEVMAGFADDSIEMLLADPPYGHSNHDGDWNARLNEHRGIEGKPIANDDAEGMRRVVDGMLAEATRLLKHDCCCCCCCGGGGPRPTFAWVAERMDRAGLTFFHSVIWNKKNPGLGWRYRRQHEMVMISHRAGGKMLWRDEGIAARNIVDMMPPRERSHPNEKPVALVEHFLDLHTSEGHLVLDPFMGGGTTGVAAARMGRRFWGIELDEAHFDTACRRIEQAYRQSALFFDRTPAAKPKQTSIFDGEAAE